MTNNTDKIFFNSLNSYLRNSYGCKVWKVPVDAGFTCPNRDGTKGSGGCVYCNSDSFSTMTGDCIREQVSRRIEQLKSRNINKYIIYFQSYSNTYADLDTMRTRIESALGFDGIAAVHIGTRPDVIDEDKLGYLKELNERYDVVLEYGLQSANDNTLKLINRGHSVNDFISAVRLTHSFGIKTCAHIIFGLPGDAEEDMMNSVDLCVSLGVHSVKFHHLHIVSGTPMAQMYLSGRIDLMPLDRYVAVLAKAISRLRPDMVVSRLLGDAAGDTLIAPKWEISKSQFTDLLIKYMTEHDLYQGSSL